jgi:hypothetical protein
MARGARRCTNPACEYGNRWVIGKMKRLRNEKWLCTGRACHTVYLARDVIDPDNDDFRLSVDDETRTIVRW